MHNFLVVLLFHCLSLSSNIFTVSISADSSPISMKWQNSLDSEKKVQAFLKSDVAFAREYVKAKNDSSSFTSYLGSGDYRLLDALNLIKNSRKDHKIVLVYDTAPDFILPFAEMKSNTDTWVWYYFPLWSGPNNNVPPLMMDDFNIEDLVGMQEHPPAFGFTSDANFGRGQYLKNDTLWLTNAMDAWYSTLNYTAKFTYTCELSLHILLNSTHPEEVLIPVVNGPMDVVFATVERYEEMILQKKDLLRKLATAFEKNRVYLNIPDSLRKQLNPEHWWDTTPSIAMRLKWGFIFLIPSSILFHLVNNFKG